MLLRFTTVVLKLNQGTIRFRAVIEIGVLFLGLLVSCGPLLDLARDTWAPGLPAGRGLRDWSVLAGGLERATQDLRLAIGADRRSAGFSAAPKVDLLLDRIELVAAFNAAPGVTLVGTLTEFAGAADDPDVAMPGVGIFVGELTLQEQLSFSSVLQDMFACSLTGVPAE